MPLDTKTVDIKKDIFDDLIRIITEMSSEWEAEFGDPIGPDTRLGEDLALSSIDFVKLAAAIQQRYADVSLPFQDLIIDGDQVKQDIRVSDLVDFLHKHLNQCH
jgi:acyl carrier protein